MNEKLAIATHERQALRRDVALVQTAILDTAERVKRVEAKLDSHAARLDKLEGAAE